MTVLMFQHRFAPMVRAYTKLQTIRPERKRPIMVGDHLLLRQWAGKAYRSPQLALGFGRCIAVEPFEMTSERITVAGAVLVGSLRETMARADGFAGIGDMVHWFEYNHRLPFRGVLIRWEKAEALP